METHKAYSARFKLKVIAFAEEKGKHQAAKLFNVDCKRVHKCCQSKVKIETLAMPKRRSSGTGRQLRYTDIEQKL